MTLLRKTKKGHYASLDEKNNFANDKILKNLNQYTVNCQNLS